MNKRKKMNKQMALGINVGAVIEKKKTIPFSQKKEKKQEQQQQTIY